jgi:hypothetical protein
MKYERSTWEFTVHVSGKHDEYGCRFSWQVGFVCSSSDVPESWSLDEDDLSLLAFDVDVTSDGPSIE